MAGKKFVTKTFRRFYSPRRNVLAGLNQPLGGHPLYPHFADECSDVFVGRESYGRLRYFVVVLFSPSSPS